MIRLMCEGDIREIVELEKLCFFDPWTKGILLQGLESRLDTFWVLEEDGVLCGYADYRMIAGEGEIQRIAVYPSCQGQGYGRKLMEQMVIFSRQQGGGNITLEVRAGNERAIKLYESCGFLKEAVRRGYYRNPPEDGIIMWNRGI